MPTIGPGESFRPPDISDEQWTQQLEDIITTTSSAYIEALRDRAISGDENAALQLERTFSNRLQGGVVNREAWEQSPDRLLGLQTGDYQVVMSEIALHTIDMLQAQMPDDPFAD